MKLTQIFDMSTDTTSADRLKHLATIVTKARKAYGNTSAEIATPDVNTTEGLQALDLTGTEDRLAIAASEFRNMKEVAAEFTKCYEGAIFDKKIEELIAISPIMANISAVIESDYL